MALFESYERRIAQINKFLKENGISSIEEAEKITKSKGLDIIQRVRDIQPICFENACWAYLVGAAVAIKRGQTVASEIAKTLGEGLQPQAARPQGDHVGIHAQQSHDLFREEKHHDGERDHHPDTQIQGDARETLRQVLAPGAQALPHEGRGGIPHPVSRHIAETLGDDCEGIGGDGNGAQRRHDERTHHVRALHHEVADPHRPGDVGRLGHHVAGRPERTRLAQDRKVLVAYEQEIQHQAGRDRLGDTRAERGAPHAHPGARHHESEPQHAQLPRGEDEQEVEHHVQGTHQDIEHAGEFHLPAAHQHRAGEETQLHHRQEGRIDTEIRGSLRTDPGFPAQPARQGGGDGGRGQGEQQGEQRDDQQSLPQDHARPGEVAGTDPVRHLDGEALPGRSTPKVRRRGCPPSTRR